MARRFSRVIADEIAFCMKDQKLTPERFYHYMNRFSDNAIRLLLPAFGSLSKKEEMK